MKEQLTEAIPSFERETGERPNRRACSPIFCEWSSEVLYLLCSKWKENQNLHRRRQSRWCRERKRRREELQLRSHPVNALLNIPYLKQVREYNNWHHFGWRRHLCPTSICFLSTFKSLQFWWFPHQGSTLDVDFPEDLLNIFCDVETRRRARLFMFKCPPVAEDLSTGSPAKDKVGAGKGVVEKPRNLAV